VSSVVTPLLALLAGHIVYVNGGPWWLAFLIGGGIGIVSAAYQERHCL
jgi:hypothetical protein